MIAWRGSPRCPPRPAGRGDAAPAVLRVSADPNNLPFTNDRGEGSRTRSPRCSPARWMPTSSTPGGPSAAASSARRSRRAKCDLVLGVPAGFEWRLTTEPYYRSSYVFVSRKDRDLAIRVASTTRAANPQVGVQLIGDDGTNTPPAHALAARGIVDNVAGFTRLRRLHRRRTRRPGSWTRWRRATSTSRSSGARWPVTSPEAATRELDARPGRAAGDRSGLPLGSTSRWGSGRGTDLARPARRDPRAEGGRDPEDPRRIRRPAGRT